MQAGPLSYGRFPEETVLIGRDRDRAAILGEGALQGFPGGLRGFGGHEAQGHPPTGGILNEDEQGGSGRSGPGSHAVGLGAHVVEHEIRGGQVVDVEVLDSDGASAVRAQVDDGVVPVGGDGEVPEARDAGERAEVDDVLPVGEVLELDFSITISTFSS